MARGTVVLVVFCADESKLERRHDRTIWRLHRWPRLFAGRPGSPGASKGSRVPTWNGNCCGHHRRFGIHGRSAARLGHDRYNRDLVRYTLRNRYWHILVLADKGLLWRM